MNKLSFYVKFRPGVHSRWERLKIPRPDDTLASPSRTLVHKNVTYLVACRFDEASSMSGSGEGFDGFEVEESCDCGVSNLLLMIQSVITEAAEKTETLMPTLNDEFQIV